MENIRFCCHQDHREMKAPAEFEIITLRAGGKVAGPDPYGDTIDACEQHVGAMLGCQPEAANVQELYWEVRLIGEWKTYQFPAMTSSEVTGAASA